jgi:hypothetical protein
MQRFVLHQLTFYDDTSGENAPCYNYNAGLTSERRKVDVLSLRYGGGS